MSTLGGRKTPSLHGSKASVYSHASTIKTMRTGGHSRVSRPTKIPWYKKPLIQHAFYTDLQRGSWHIGFFTLFLGIWTAITSGFDIYCLHEATPGTNHTGYYIISFDFVYVGNPHIRNLLIMSAVFSMLFGVAILITSVMLLDALRKEQEVDFKGWLWVMGLFTPWRIIAWVYATIVNDMIFAYNIIMFIAWLIFNVLSVLSFICIYSLYLELNDLTKIQDLARLKLASGAATHSSRPRSRMSSRPASVRSQQGYQMCNMGGIQQAPMASMPSSLMSQQATMSSQQQYGELGYASQSHEGASQSVTSEEPSVVTQVPRRQKRSRPNSLVSQGSGYGSQRHSVVSQDPVYSSQRHSVTSPMSQQFQSLTLSQQGYPSNKRHSLASEASQDPTYPFQRHNLASQGPTYLSQRHSVTSPQQFQSLTLSQQGYPSQPHHNITGEGSQRHSLASQPTSQISENIYILPDISEMDTMSSMPASRAASAYGSRPTSPYATRDALRREQQQQLQQQLQQQQQQQQYGYGYSRY